MAKLLVPGSLVLRHTWRILYKSECTFKPRSGACLGLADPKEALSFPL